MKRLSVLLLCVAVTVMPAVPLRAADSTMTISQGVDAEALNPLATTITP